MLFIIYLLAWHIQTLFLAEWALQSKKNVNYGSVWVGAGLTQTKIIGKIIPK